MVNGVTRLQILQVQFYSTDKSIASVKASKAGVVRREREREREDDSVYDFSSHGPVEKAVPHALNDGKVAECRAHAACMPGNTRSSGF